MKYLEKKIPNELKRFVQFKTMELEKMCLYRVTIQNNKDLKQLKEKKKTESVNHEK